MCVIVTENTNKVLCLMYYDLQSKSERKAGLIDEKNQMAKKEWKQILENLASMVH